MFMFITEMPFPFVMYTLYAAAICTIVEGHTRHTHKAIRRVRAKVVKPDVRIFTE